MDRVKIKNAGIVVLILGVTALFIVLSINKHAQTVKERAEQKRARAAEAAEKAERQEELAEKQRRQRKKANHQAALASVHFDSDPHNEFPVMSLGEMTKRLYDRRNPLELEPGQRVRILATLQEENLNRSSLHFRYSPAAFLFQNYDFAIPYVLLEDFQPGDEVEFIVVYDGEKDDSVEGHYASSTMYFHGTDIQKVPAI